MSDLLTDALCLWPAFAFAALLGAAGYVGDWLRGESDDPTD